MDQGFPCSFRRCNGYTYQIWPYKRIYQQAYASSNAFTHANNCCKHACMHSWWVRLPKFLSYAQSAHSHWGFNQQIKLLCFLCRWFRSQRKLTGKIQSLTKRDIMILYSVDGWFVWCTACKKSTFRYNFLLSCKFKTLIRSLLQNCDLRWSCRSVCESICHSGTQYELSLLCHIVNLSQCHIIKFVNDTFMRSSRLAHNEVVTMSLHQYVAVSHIEFVTASHDDNYHSVTW